MLDNENIRNQFIQTAVDNINTKNLENENNDTINQHFIHSINSAAEANIPKLTKNRIIHPWHNDEKLDNLYRQKDELMTKNIDSTDIKKLRKKIRLRARFLKNEYLKTEAEKLNQLAINRNLQKFFQKAKEQSSTLSNIQFSCPTQSLLNHFKSHFNPTKRQNTPTELSSDDLPHFVTQLRQISATTNIKSKPPDSMSASMLT